MEEERGYLPSLDLCRAHIFLESDQRKEGGEILERVAGDLIEVRDQEPELYCYFLYLRTLEKEDPVYTHETLMRIKDYYEEINDSFKILLLMIYLEREEHENASLQYARIKQQYQKGCRSPFLYLEAVKILNESPEFLRALNVLNFRFYILE
jgi:hypothetical protein